MYPTFYRFLLFLLMFFASLTNLYSQEVKDVSFSRGPDNTIKVSYTISSAMFYEQFDVSLYVSTDGGQTYNGPLQHVSGDVGKDIEAGDHTITWDVFKEVASLEGDVVFDVRAKVIEEKIKKDFALSYLGSLDAPLGFIIGQIGKTGWYFSAKARPVSNPKYTYGGESWSPGLDGPQYYEFTSTENIRRLSFTAGFTWQLGKNFFIYTGVGYGIKDLLWQMEIYDYENDAMVSEEYVKQPDYSYAGLEAEGGMMYRAGKFLISGGVTTVNFQYTNLTLGVGMAL